MNGDNVFGEVVDENFQEIARKINLMNEPMIIRPESSFKNRIISAQPTIPRHNSHRGDSSLQIQLLKNQIINNQNDLNDIQKSVRMVENYRSTPKLNNRSTANFDSKNIINKSMQNEECSLFSPVYKNNLASSGRLVTEPSKNKTNNQTTKIDELSQLVDISQSLSSVNRFKKCGGNVYKSNELCNNKMRLEFDVNNKDNRLNYYMSDFRLNNFDKARFDSNSVLGSIKGLKNVTVAEKHYNDFESLINSCDAATRHKNYNLDLHNGLTAQFDEKVASRNARLIQKVLFQNGPRKRTPVY